MGEYALGQPVGRFEDLRLLRGGGRYVADMVLPGMVFGHVLRSPHAHAKILSLDTAGAKQAPGVLAVLTHEDWEASGYGDLPIAGGFKRRDGGPMYRPPFPALVKDHVRFVGDYVAFVIAETQAQAMDAAELIEVEYEPLPAVTLPHEAVKPGAVTVWEKCPDNVCFNHEEGDRAATEAALKQAKHVVHRRFRLNRVTAATMEPRGSIAWYDRSQDHYTVYTTLQRTHTFREQLAKTLKVPESKVRVVAGDIGGSFGMKSGVYNEVGLVLLGSKLTGRPVKWISTRSEAFLSDAGARDNVTEATLGLDAHGKFLALKVGLTANLGAYIQPGAQGAPTANLGTLAGVYTIGAMHVDVTALFTNTQPMRPYRGNGRPEAAFVIERIIDVAADELGLDKVEIRRRNIIPVEAMPYKTALTFTYDCGEFEKSMDMALKLGDWPGFDTRRAEARKRGKLRGIGISNSIEKAASPGYEGAEIRFDRAGSLTILSGAVTQGQGHETIFKQMVADRFGLDPKEIQYVQGDTEAVFYGEGTGGSRTAATGGGAMLMAADKIEAKATTLAAHLLKVERADIEVKDGIFTSRKTNRSLTMKEVAKAASDYDDLPDGFEPGLTASAVYHLKQENFPNGCHVCELEIDEETGAVQILRYSVVDDVGFVMNPLLLKGQIQGGIAQGVGQMLMEDISYEPGSGQLLTGSFMDYAMPHADNLSAIEVKSNPVPTKTNLLGVKGAGEAGCVGALPATANALVDALSVLGIRDVEMPATPERLWRAISAAKNARA